ncbi:DUF1127 domain-containing protein [Rubellimicrobium aerolatum]|uniref:DUF1127 domain-containing protein n=1 Tax=Rubellimicrobium aerolatum TaxID=490979 RepID=A0ABW0SAN3_9RHOB|nr:DUF1127 domain-containing protein [Rubellimicrobium aerolatum]MBP1805314.1 uncharacterized protein YjiS (DUF1127 family) [Rubellimicrobium aerolatum]
MSEFHIPSTAPLRPRRAGLLARLAGCLALRAEDRALQRQLARLAGYDDHLLDDIGLSREAAPGQAARAAWGAVDWLTMTRAR